MYNKRASINGRNSVTIGIAKSGHSGVDSKRFTKRGSGGLEGVPDQKIDSEGDVMLLGRN